MRNSKCKKLRKYAKQYKRQWMLQTWEQLYSTMKRVYKKTPNPKREEFTGRMRFGYLDALELSDKNFKKTIKKA